MLTGDAPQVAGAVALKLGLVKDSARVMTGTQFDALSSDEQAAAVDAYSVFARVSPEQKFRIMAGLKRADVGIAVENAADIAKEVSDVILTRKSLSAIIDGIEIGRRNFANIIKYLKITLASNFGNFYSVAVASLFVPFLPMLPVQILLLNLLTDAPMIAVAADSVPVGELKRPSHYDARTVIVAATALGIVSSAFDFLTFGVFHALGEGSLQTLWFMESSLTELILILAVRTSGPFYRGPALPKSIAAILGSVAAAVVILPYTGIGQELFGFVAPKPWQLAAVAGIVAAYFLSTEVIKLRLRAFLNGGIIRERKAGD